MKVLHITAQKPGETGSGIYLSGVIKGFFNKVDKQALIAGFDINDNLNDIINKFDNKVDIFPIKYNKGKLNFDIPGMSDSMPYKSSTYKSLTEEMLENLKNEYTKVIKKAIYDFKPDVIITHHLYFISAIAVDVVKKEKKKIKVIGVCHGTCLRQLNNTVLKNDYNSFIKKHIGELDLILALHSEQKNYIQKMFSVEKNKIKVIGSGFDNSIFNSFNCEKNKESIKIAYAGKICKSKGLESLFKALNCLNVDSDINVKLAGTGSDKKTYDEIIKLGEQCKYKVEFLGQINQIELAKVFKQSDLFILPSFYEGLPLVLLEALACNCEVICTDVLGVKEWLSSNKTVLNNVDFIKLPKMEKLGVPVKEELPKFDRNLAFTIHKKIEKIKNENTIKSNLCDFTWEGLSNKIFDLIEK